MEEQKKQWFKDGHEFPRLLAHCGNHEKYTENGKMAFEYSLANGATGFETDFRMSADGVIMVIHDSSTARTTDTDIIVEHSTLADLRKVKLKNSDESIPTAEEIFSLFDQREGFYIELEMKARYGELYSTDETLLNPGYTPPYVEPSGEYWYPNEMYNSALAFSRGMYKQSAFGLVAFEGDVLRLGVKGKSNQGNDSWVIWDNFKLIYRGFKPEVVQPRLEEAIEDVKAYEGMLMGKTEFATLSKALADAEAAIAAQDGEAMFQALVAIYGVKDAARVSKDAFLEKEVPADTANLAQVIRDVEGLKLSKTTLAAANELLQGLEENTIYETEEVEQIHTDVVAMIDRLYYSVNNYQALAEALADLNGAITEAKQYETIDANLIARAERLYNADTTIWGEGAIEDDNISNEINTIYALVDELWSAINIATGIEELNATREEAPIYNMAGQKVQKAQKGLYIRNGKKVVIK